MALSNPVPLNTMASSPAPIPPLGPPHNPSLISLNNKYNMSANSISEALLLISSMYISLVQPEAGPANVGLHAIFPKTQTVNFEREIITPFSNELKRAQTLQRYPNIRGKFNISTGLNASEYVPKDLLQILCDHIFPKNTITIIYINNHLKLQEYQPHAAKYLPQVMESLGLPIISYDTQFSFNSKPEFSVQLAPTMGQMMDVFFAFLRRFQWRDFSFLCTLSIGCEDEITAIRDKVAESHRKSNVSQYGVDDFSHNLLSYVNFTKEADEDEIEQKLKYELHQDTRIVFVHGDSGEVKNVMDVAKRLGLTGVEYVWIYTISSITESRTVSKSYPLGSFFIGYDADRENAMPKVLATARDIWLQTLNSLAASPDMDEINFKTGFSCNRDGRESNTSASKGNSTTGSVGLRWKYGNLLYKHMKAVKLPGNQEFDKHGILKMNTFWIKNVQKEPTIRRTQSSRNRGGGGAFGGSRGHSSRNRGRGSSSSRYGGGSSSRGYTPRRSSSNTGSSHTAGTSRTSPYGGSGVSRRRDRSQSLSTGYGAGSSRNASSARRSSYTMPSRRGTSEGGQSVGDRTYRRRSRRVSRSTRQKQILVKIADWDGQNLTVQSLTWPGGASKPPKGKPGKYMLKVVTWKEDPQVVYVEKRKVTAPDEEECDANSIPCQIYDRDSNNMRLSNNTRDVCCTGLCIDLLKKLGEMLHFDIDLREVADGAYGSPLNDNLTQWDGMLGALLNEEADMAMGALSITPQRSEVVDFSVPFLQTGITIIVAIREGAISPTAFLEPYDYPSWSLILVFSVHATGASIFIFEWLSPYGLDQGKTPLSVHKFSLFRSFWLIWAMLFGASVSTDQPRGCASRFLANIWALFAVVFCASYTANLAAFMITKDDYYDLSGIQDWRLKNPNHRKPPFKFATIAKSATDLNIQENYKEIHMYMKQNPQTDVKSAIKALKAQDIQAFIYDSTTLEYEVGKDDGCRLKTVGKRIAETGYGVAFPKKSQWTRQIDKALLWLQEDGEIERLQKFWLAGACHKKKETGVSSHMLGILNFTSAFILLGAGVVLGILLLILEHCYFRFGRKSLKKWDKCGCCSLVSLSMGQSLTFEQSVMEAIDFHRHHKCKDPLCETQLWKVKHELDLALLKIAQLRKQLAHTSALEASREDMPSIEDSSGASPPHNGSLTKRRRQTAEDELRASSRGSQRQSTQQPLLGHNGTTKSDSESDEDNTPKKSSAKGGAILTPEVEYVPRSSGNFNNLSSDIDPPLYRDVAEPGASASKPRDTFRYTPNDSSVSGGLYSPSKPMPPQSSLDYNNTDVGSARQPDSLYSPISPPGWQDAGFHQNHSRPPGTVDNSVHEYDLAAAYRLPQPLSHSEYDSTPQASERLDQSRGYVPSTGNSSTSGPSTRTKSQLGKNGAKSSPSPPRGDDGNVYVNVDKIIGKETFF